MDTTQKQKKTITIECGRYRCVQSALGTRDKLEHDWGGGKGARRDCASIVLGMCSLNIRCVNIDKRMDG